VKALKEQFLIFRIRTFRDERAFAQLVESYRKELYRFLRARVRSEEDALDGASEIFFRVWNFLVTSHSDDHHFRGLLYHTARFWIGNYYRRANPTVPLEEMEDRGEAVRDEKEGEDAIVARADAEVVRGLLRKLKPEHAEAISLRFFQDMDMREVARRMEKTENATRVMLHRALKELRNYL
jgi:RNA polymerase sigma-70 factor (ECF subfamily)